MQRKNDNCLHTNVGDLSALVGKIMRENDGRFSGYDFPETNKINRDLFATNLRKIRNSGEGGRALAHAKARGYWKGVRDVLSSYKLSRDCHQKEIYLSRLVKSIVEMLQKEIATLSTNTLIGQLFAGATLEWRQESGLGCPSLEDMEFEIYLNAEATEKDLEFLLEHSSSIPESFAKPNISLSVKSPYDDRYTSDPHLFYDGGKWAKRRYGHCHIF